MASCNSESLPEPVEELNILLLGESGVGKSTFINACFNYLKYNTLAEVMANELQVLIPAKFTLQDMNYEHKVVSLKVSDNHSEPDDIVNEILEDGKAATQNVQTYVFSMIIGNKKYKVRFLDTPGMGDQRGGKQDEKNCDLILGYISQLKEIHGFCLLLKPSNSRLDVFMNYCIFQILSRLENSAVKNVCFVFTNTRGHNFTAGHTYTPLKVLLDNIKKNNNLSIPFSRQNMFCFDNEPFRYVAAVKNGVELEPFIYGNTESSWNRSVAEFGRMLTYISQLPPYDLKKTISVNDARTMASNLAEPVTQIVQLIQDNISKLEQHSEELSKAQTTKEQLEAKMHTPQIEINVKQLDYPNTVCLHPACVSTYEVNGIRKQNYKQKCCTECMVPLTNWGIIGSIALSQCNAFSWSGACTVCSHGVSSHKHIFYETQIFEKKVDKSMVPIVNSHAELVKVKEDFIESLQKRQQEFEYERQYLLQSCAILDQYLKKNTVTPIGNPVEEYLKCEIARETTGQRDSNDKTVDTLRGLLAQYEKEKSGMEAGRSEENREITPEEIEEIKQKLMNLKHFGQKIMELYNAHQAGIKKAPKKMEKIVKSGIGFFRKFQDFVNRV